MVRTILCSAALFAAFASGLYADDQTNKNKPNDQGKASTGENDKTNKTKTAQGKDAEHAKITTVDAKKGTVTVRMKGKDGKDHDRTFTLTEEVRMLDDSGRIAAMDVFQSGNEVLIVESEGRLREIHKHTPKTGNSSEKQKSSTTPDNR